MTDRKNNDEKLKNYILNTFGQLRLLREKTGASLIELIELTKVGALYEIDQNLIAIDETLAGICANLDNYVAERIETDKVLVRVLRDIEDRAVIVQMDPKVKDQAKQIDALEQKIDQHINKF